MPRVHETRGSNPLTLTNSRERRPTASHLAYTQKIAVQIRALLPLPIVHQLRHWSFKPEKTGQHRLGRPIAHVDNWRVTQTTNLAKCRFESYRARQFLGYLLGQASAF